MIKLHIYIGLLIPFCLSQSPFFIENIDLAYSQPDKTIKIIGASKNERLGGSVSRAGDVNGDGIGDIILGNGIEDMKFDPEDPLERILAYVIYGNKTESPMLDLKYFDESQGFKVIGSAGNNNYIAVSGAGDFNGDGIDDIIIGDVNNRSFGRFGVVYVLFGRKGNLTDVNVDNLNSTQGVRIIGSERDFLGYSVSKAGDLNGDGINDIIIGNECYSQGQQVAAYVIFGSKDMHTDINVTTLRSSQGIKIISEGLILSELRPNTKYSVSEVGDFNGDGFADIIIGSSCKSYEGAAYIIFGKQNGLSDTDLAYLYDYNGIKIVRTDRKRYRNDRQKTYGFVVSGAGDMNRDGLADVIIATHIEHAYAGAAYIIFGKRDRLPIIDLDDLTYRQGISIFNGNRQGKTVSSVGDINNDGVDDVIIGAATKTWPSFIGFAYVIYGSKSKLSDIDITTADYRQGFMIVGKDKTTDPLGFSVSSAGDIDGDGIQDLLVAVSDATVSERDKCGVVYLILSSKLGIREPESFIRVLPITIAVLIVMLLIAFKVYQYVRRKFNPRPYMQVR